MTENTLLSRKELAQKLGVNRITIKRYEKKGLPVIHISFKKPRYDYDKVIQWFEEREKKQK